MLGLECVDFLRYSDDSVLSSLQVRRKGGYGICFLLEDES